MSHDHSPPRPDGEQPARDRCHGAAADSDDTTARDRGDDTLARRDTDTDGTPTSGVSRRAALAAGVGAAVGLSGCLGISLDGGDGTATPGSATQTAPTQTTATQTTAATESVTQTGTPTADGATRAVTVRLPRAPAGVQKFAFTVSHDSVSVTGVRAGAVDGEEFQVVSGGDGARRVRVRGADLSRSVQERSDPVPLFTVTFARAVTPANLAVTAETLVADDGSSLTDEWTLRATTPPE